MFLDSSAFPGLVGEDARSRRPSMKRAKRPRVRRSSSESMPSAASMAAAAAAAAVAMSPGAGVGGAGGGASSGAGTLRRDSLNELRVGSDWGDVVEAAAADLDSFDFNFDDPLLPTSPDYPVPSASSASAAHGLPHSAHNGASLGPDDPAAAAAAAAAETHGGGEAIEAVDPEAEGAGKTNVRRLSERGASLFLKSMLDEVGGLGHGGEGTAGGGGVGGGGVGGGGVGGGGVGEQTCSRRPSRRPSKFQSRGTFAANSLMTAMKSDNAAFHAAAVNLLARAPAEKIVAAALRVIDEHNREKYRTRAAEAPFMAAAHPFRKRFSTTSIGSL